MIIIWQGLRNNQAIVFPLLLYNLSLIVFDSNEVRNWALHCCVQWVQSPYGTASKHWLLYSSQNVFWHFSVFYRYVISVKKKKKKNQVIWQKQIFTHKSLELTEQCKGQLISKCPFGVIVLTKIPTKKFDNFCPRI